MGTEKIQTQIRKDQIVRAVLDQISRHGLKGLNVAAVAAEIGLVPSALYRHFKGKEEMVAAALEVIRRKLLGNVDAVCKETEDPLERLRLLLGRHLEMLRDNQAIPRIIFSEDAGYPDRKKKVYQTLKTFLSRVEAIVRGGQKAGQIRGGICPGNGSGPVPGAVSTRRRPVVSERGPLRCGAAYPPGLAHIPGSHSGGAIAPGPKRTGG